MCGERIREGDKITDSSLVEHWPVSLVIGVRH